MSYYPKTSLRLKDKDLNDFNLAFDRINLHFKGVDNVPFSSVEQTWVDKSCKS